eukprot:GSChrysophyteH1.ASY1.ANO1.823.1 assembled CDS
MMKDVLLGLTRRTFPLSVFRAPMSTWREPLDTNIYTPSLVSASVLYEDNHLLVVNKLPGQLAQGDRTGDESLLEQCRKYLANSRGKKLSTVYLGLVHRIDRVTSGVMIYAKTSKAAARLSEEFRRRSVQKHYLCVVDVIAAIPDAGELEHWLDSDRAKHDGGQINRSVAVAEASPGSKLAQLCYEKIHVNVESHAGERKQQALLHVRPTTGRKHQIRAQLSESGWPIVGDVKYGAPQRFRERDIALHSLCISIRHPTNWEKTLVLTADVPAKWEERFGPEVLSASRSLQLQLQLKANEQ